MVIILPTLLFIVSQILRYGLKARTKKELIGQQAPESAWIFTKIGHQSSREFKWEFFIDAVILSMVNGLILIFELARIEYGVILLLVGVILALAGLVAIEADSNAVGLLILAIILLLLSEMSYFAFFGLSYSVLGLSMLPRHVFFLPSLVLLILLAIVALWGKRKR